MLNTALKAGPQLESLVVTSSVAAVSNPITRPNTMLTELDFAHDFLDKAEEDRKNGQSTPANVLYAASKTAAEHAIWKFRDEKRVHVCATVQNFNQMLTFFIAILLHLINQSNISYWTTCAARQRPCKDQ